MNFLPPCLIALMLAAAGPAQEGRALEPVIHGPFVGHVSTTEATLWLRAIEEGELTVRVGLASDPEAPAVSRKALATLEHDLCVRWTISGLSPGTLYRYSIFKSGLQVEGDGAAPPNPVAGPFEFSTAPPDDTRTAVKLAFGSCADEDEASGEVWQQINAAQVHAVVLLGDTPYIDSTALEQQRKRYREFAGHPPLAKTLQHTPWYGTWDDHDFGRDGANGTLEGKQRARQVFMEYHANSTFGERDEGVYTSFRQGPVETFLLDTRWFAGTAPSSFDESQVTLLGEQQWAWLARALKASSAPVKVIASGMIFNDAVRPNKPDYWGAYPAERRGLFELIGRHKIEGVILVSGDIHRSRVVRHASKGLAGYDITELITSPMHHRIIASANAPHPGLVWDMGLKNSFLLLTVERRGPGAHAQARFIDRFGTVAYELEVLP